MSDLSGNDFTTGAISAGLNEALQKELGEWEEQNRAANQWVSLAMGAALDKAAGSSSNIGAVAALSIDGCFPRINKQDQPNLPND